MHKENTRSKAKLSSRNPGSNLLSAAMDHPSQNALFLVSAPGRRQDPCFFEANGLIIFSSGALHGTLDMECGGMLTFHNVP